MRDGSNDIGLFKVANLEICIGKNKILSKLANYRVKEFREIIKIIKNVDLGKYGYSFRTRKI